MKTKVQNLKIKRYDFKGYLVFDDMEYIIEGDFIVTFKGQYPKVSVRDLAFSGLFQDSDIANLVDIADLEEQILETDDGSWYYDYLDYKAEQQWERMEDR